MYSDMKSQRSDISWDSDNCDTVTRLDTGAGNRNMHDS